MPRISTTVGGVTYVIGGWTSFELSRRQIEKAARDSLPNEVEGGDSEDPPNNESDDASVQTSEKNSKHTYIGRAKTSSGHAKNPSGHAKNPSGHAVTNNEYLCSVIHSVRKQTVSPLKIALHALREKLRALERGVERSTALTVTPEQVGDLLEFLEKPTWPLHAKHLVKFKSALESSGVVPDMPIMRVDPFKERYVDPFNPRTKKDMKRKLEEFEVLLAQMASYVDKVSSSL
jgi:hypothetical protein